MNTGQMMIGIAAFALVTMTILNFNRGSMVTQDALIYNKEFIVATTLAQSILDEISNKAYDEEIIQGNTITSASDFSLPLTSDPGEIYPDFDDVDDYNNFSWTETIPGMGVFNIEVSVDYMTDGLATTTAKTYNKNVTIRISSSTLVNFFTDEADTLVISSLFSKWAML